MKRKGKTNKTLAGLAPLDRHGFDRYGDNYMTDFAPAVQFVHFTKKFALEAESDSSPHVRKLSRYWWREQTKHLGAQFRDAIRNRDGSFFRAIANVVESIGETPVDPLREWIDRTFFHVVSDGKGIRTEQYFGQDKTSDELYSLFISETRLARKDRPGLEVFTNTLREMRVKWKKRPGGRKPKTPTEIVRHSLSP